MPTDRDSGLVEPDILINGRALTYAECMTVRVAVSSFRIWLSEPNTRVGLGEPLAGNYDHHARAVEETMVRGFQRGPACAIAAASRRDRADHAALAVIARGAWHLLQSLLAVREGPPDESLRTMADALLAAIERTEGRDGQQ